MPQYLIEENRRCFKCGSSNVGPLFERTDSPEPEYRSVASGKVYTAGESFYDVYYDCLCCYFCHAWDFPDPDLWTHPVVVGGFTCDCGSTRLTVIENDFLADTFEVKCQQCGKEHTLEKETA